MTTPPTNANPTLSLNLPGYDPAGNQINVAINATGITTDPETGVVYGNFAVTTTPSGTGTQAVSGTVTANQGTSASQGTSWRIQGDFTELSGLTAGSLNADLVPSTDVSAYKWLSLHINTNAYSGTLTFQCSNDNINWISLALSQPSSSSYTATTTSTNVLFNGPIAFRFFRVRMTSYSSGTAQGTLELYTNATMTASIGIGTNGSSVSQSGTWTVQPGNTANTTPWLANTNSPYPSGATPLTASSGNVANAQAVATLAGTSAKTTYITGFEVTGSGATLGLPVTVTVTGLISGTMSYTYSAIAGALLENTPLAISFVPAIPASATNTSIVVTCPALGSGNTNNVSNAHGYQL